MSNNLEKWRCGEVAHEAHDNWSQFPSPLPSGERKLLVLLLFRVVSQEMGLTQMTSADMVIAGASEPVSYLLLNRNQCHCESAQRDEAISDLMNMGPRSLFRARRGIVMIGQAE